MLVNDVPRTAIEIQDYAGDPCHKTNRVLVNGEPVCVELGDNGVNVEVDNNRDGGVGTVVVLRLLPTELAFTHNHER